MAKLTLTFKGKLIRVFHFEFGEILIGRDPSSTIQIDSLAVASSHASIALTANGDLLKPLDAKHLVYVNEQPISEHLLGHGDYISIGKHTLCYEKDDQVLEDLAVDGEDSNLNTRGGQMGYVSPVAADAKLQILTGESIGRVFPLKGALTRLGRGGSAGAAVIARRKDGYYLSSLERGAAIKVNAIALGDKSVRLSDGDLLQVDDKSMQFYLDE